jgi:7-cyano-7-deazaguanine synthase
VTNPAVVLLSGGLDSATALALALSTGLEAHALTIDYGQRHRVELDAARAVAQDLGAASHKILRLDLRAFGGSALTDDIDVPAYGGEGVPVTYVPGRNTIFLSLGMAYCETLDADSLFIGVSSVDYSGYPDCRPEFVGAFEQMANLATKRAIEGHRFNICAPLLRLSKAATIRLGRELGVNYDLTHSCYDPLHDGQACGRCDSCVLRQRGFEEA